MRVLVLRAVDDARRTARRLAAAGHEAILSPVLEIRMLPNEIPHVKCDALVATSAHAFGADAPPELQDVPLFVVGERTAQAARRAGYRALATVRPDAAALVPALQAAFRAQACVLYLAGRDRKSGLEQSLAPRYDLRVIETYAADEAARFTDDARGLLEQGRIDAVLHYSRRSAAAFRRLVAGVSLDLTLAGLRHVAISADAAAPLIDAGWPVDIADQPKETAMIRTLDATSGPCRTECGAKGQ